MLMCFWEIYVMGFRSKQQFLISLLPCVYTPLYPMMIRLPPPLPRRYSITLDKRREPQGSVRQQ